MKSSNPNSGSRRVDIAKTLDCADPSPAKNQGGQLVVQARVFGQTSYDKYVSVEQAATLKAMGGNYGGGTENLVLDAHGVIPYTLKIRSGCGGGVKVL